MCRLRRDDESLSSRAQSAQASIVVTAFSWLIDELHFFIESAHLAASFQSHLMENLIYRIKISTLKRAVVMRTWKECKYQREYGKGSAHIHLP